MPLLSSCPKCDAPVLIPDGVDASAKSKCPLCSEQFELGEALGNLPPMLEIIDQPVAVGVGTDASSGEMGSGVFGGLLADVSNDDARNGESAESESGVLTIEPESESENDSGASGDSGGFGAIDFGETSETPDAALDSPEGAAPPSLASKARTRRKKGPGALFQIGGVALFGIVGLGIGYTILLLIKGPQGDFLEIGKYFPSWIYKSDKGSAEGSDPNVAVNGSSSKKKKSKKDRDRNGGKNGGSDLPSLNFNFDKPRTKIDKDGKPVPRAVGPLKLEQTLRHHIEQAIDEVAVAAVTYGAEEEKVKDGKEEGNDLKFADRDHYFALANLGKVISASKAGSLNDKLIDRITLFVHNAVGTDDKFDAAGDKATKWLGYKKRKERDGILLAGMVESLKISPTLFEAKFTVAGTGEKLIVVSEQKAPSPGQRLLVLGVIVKDPKENLTGYKGNQEQVVWMELGIKPPEQGAPPIDIELPEVDKPEVPNIELPPVDEKKPDIGEPEIEPPTIDEPTIKEPAIEEPVIDEPVIDEPAIDEPAIDEPTIDEPVIEEPAIDGPAKPDES